ncbi:MAG: hypothetical protein ACREPE_00430 [Lysobacter sp.]
MTHHAGQRLRITLLVVFCLLFQQAALAAYACPLDQMPPDPMVMAEDCAELGMQQAMESPALCAKHCAPDLSVAADHVLLNVPGIALPPAAFELVLAEPLSHVALVADAPVDRSDPPPRLRYCSLLI